MTGVLSAVDSPKADSDAVGASLVPDGEDESKDKKSNSNSDGDGDPKDPNGETNLLKDSDTKIGNESKPQPKIDFLKDDITEMTVGRRIALKLMDRPWYNPALNDREEEEGAPAESASKKEEESNSSRTLDDFDEDVGFENPSLEKGWAFFEHQALYRYTISEGYDMDKPKKSLCTRLFRALFVNKNKKYDRAEPGEDEVPSRLYNFSTPHDQLGDFGLGIGLYFSSLRILIVISLICGFISLPNMLYFASDEYNINGGQAVKTPGSAVCTSVDWVPCPTCECHDGFNYIEGRLPQSRCIIEDGLTFAKKNTCDGTKWDLPATNFAALIFMLISIMIMGWYMRREEVKFDEDEQTAQDYSIHIKNPPGDANNPEEWRKFFKENCDGAKLAVCTCAVENDLLVHCLVERREVMRNIHSKRPGENMEMLVLAKIAAEIETKRNMLARILAKVVPDIPEYFARLTALKGKVEGLAQLKYPVTNVFLTFETEEDQRKVLQNLSVGHMTAQKNDHSALSDPKYLFRGEIVLDVAEPEEPNTIRWQSLNVSLSTQSKQKTYTVLITLVTLSLVAYAIRSLSRTRPIFVSYMISFVNVVFPVFVNAMIDYLETHKSETEKQTSMYMKIVLFRWTTTAILYFLVTPFYDTLDGTNEGLIVKIEYLFISDIIVSNLYALVDPVGHIQRHYSAPRAKTQDAMNILFEGLPYELAERYSDMTKILFLCLFYSSIFPFSFFMCAISLTLKYWVDKWNLMRTWKRAPALGPVITRMSRQYFYLIAVGFMAVFSSYYWSAFSFDNLCPNEGINQTYIGTFSFTADTQESGVISFTDADVDYRFCNMEWKFVSILGNAMNHEYMTEDQIISTTYFGWSAFAIVIIILGKFLYLWYSGWKQLYISNYEPVGETQGIAWSEVDSRSAYIPQVESSVFAYPLVACKTDGMDEELFDFKDPDRAYRYYDLTVDADKLLSANSEIAKNNKGFSIVKSWKPDEDD